jgi:isoleucyl-tRNA synthetase
MGTARTSGARAAGRRISQHELIGSTRTASDPSLYVRLPLLDATGEALVVWTTTPWTLPANVAAAVDPTPST